MELGGLGGVGLDLAHVLQASQALAGEIRLDALLARTLQLVMETAGADHGWLLEKLADRWVVQARGESGRVEQVLLALPADECAELPQSIIRTVIDTGRPLLLSDPLAEPGPVADPALLQNRPRSLLCYPLVLEEQGRQVGLIYLECRQTAEGVNAGRLQLLQLLSSQAAVALQNARLYEGLERQVGLRMRELEQEVLERQRAESEMQASHQAIRLLYEAGEQLGRTLEPDEIYRTLHRVVRSAMPCDSLLVSAFNATDRQIRLAWGWGPAGEHDVTRFPPIPLEAEGRGTQSRVIRSGETLLLRDYQAYFRTSQTAYYVNNNDKMLETEVEPDDGEVIRSAVILPLRLKNQVLGVIQVMSFRLDAYRQGQVRFLEALAPQVAAATANAELYRQAQEEIAERKRAEEALIHYSERLQAMVDARTRELQAAQEQLLRQEKLAALGQLAGGVGHELRNPLGVIANAVYFLRMAQPNAGEQVLEYLAMIADEVSKADKIVRDLLEFGRLQVPQRRPTPLHDLVGEVLERRVPSGPFVVRVDLPDDLPPVMVDAQHLEQVLNNLVTNACQAMPDGGELVVSAELRGGPDGGPSGPWVALAVRDSGVGIRPEHMERVFEPLFTTKTRGIGLGLAISKKLIEANGGEIQVASLPGTGTAFTLLLPVA